MNWQKVKRFSPKKLTSESFDNDNKRTFKNFLAVWCVCCVFFNKDQRRTDGNDFQTDTVSEFQNTPELKKAKTYSALSFDRINFFNKLVFTFSETLCYMLIFSRANKNFIFLTPVKWLSNRASCTCFRTPNWEKPHNKHLISLVFSVCTVNYGSSFFSSNLWPARKILGP